MSQWSDEAEVETARELDRLATENGLYYNLVKVLHADLTIQAAFHDTSASEDLEKTGNYFFFDEPKAVERARKLLKFIETTRVLENGTSDINTNTSS